MGRRNGTNLFLPRQPLEFFLIYDGEAQLFGLGENLFVLEAELFRNVVNSNGHNYLTQRGPG